MQTNYTKEELTKWTVPQLSGYLKNHGVVIWANGGRKDQLGEKVFYAKQLGLQILPSKEKLGNDRQNEEEKPMSLLIE